AGLGRYSERLALALHALQPGRYTLFYNQGRDGRLPDSLKGFSRRSVRLGYKPWRMAVLLAHLGHVAFNQLVPDAQLFHSTEHLLMPLRDAPTVLTVHDLIYKLFPAYHKKLNYWYLNLAMPLYCQRADAIIAVSEASKQDVVAHYRLDPTKVYVVYEAAAEHFRPPTTAQIDHVRQRYHLPDHFLLHLGTIEPRKNLGRLLDALQLLRRDFPDLCLLLAGAKGWLYDDFFRKVEADGLGQVVLSPGWIPDEELPSLIAAADLAVQPSLYEGFGLPILEEMACGQVVAASHSSSHPEVGGEAAAYFAATDVEEMAAVIGRLLGDPAERQHRRQLGLAQAQRFTWRRAAQETAAVYEKLLPKNGNG
ncbi:MAG: glycosyltransferase family 1 protein, partial [Chloroflexota bacterium]